MIEFDNVTLRHGEHLIINQLDYTFLQATPYVIRGASGAGKTTLLNLAGSYLAPSTGSITTRGDVDYLLQEDLLLSELTVRENLCLRQMGANRSALSSEAALARLGMEQYLDVRAGSLSGGERRRVELAGVALAAPSNLLLDEPVANLDPASRATVYESLWNSTQELTVIVVTHEDTIPFLPTNAIELELKEGILHG